MLSLLYRFPARIKTGNQDHDFPMNLQDSSYSKHADVWNTLRRDNPVPTGKLSLDEPQTADQWRHARMFDPVHSFLHHPQWRWLTVGDGRFGMDSVLIRNLGIKNVLPTDIGGALLSKSKEAGLIPDYSVENAERLSFADDSFDISFCKESYHHFPRPAIALYEMIRVSRQAVILIEPRDYPIDRPPIRNRGPLGLLRDLKRWLSLRLKLPMEALPVSQRYLLGDSSHYEDSGNYMFALSSREVEKVALGMNLPTIALKGINDCFLPEGGTAPPSDGSVVFAEMTSNIAAADLQSRLGLGSTSLLMAIIFVQEPDSQTRHYLEENDWLVKDLTRNPHL